MLEQQERAENWVQVIDAGGFPTFPAYLTFPTYSVFRGSTTFRAAAALAAKETAE